MKIYTKITFIIAATIAFVGCTKEEDIEIYSSPKTLFDGNFNSTNKVLISQLYKATGTSYNDTSTLLNIINSVTATDITFTPEVSKNDVFTYGGYSVPLTLTSPNVFAVKGTLSYKNSTGNIIFLPGFATKQIGTGAITGAETNGFSFVTMTDNTYNAFTGEAYILVLPKRESTFVPLTNVVFNVTPRVDNVLNNLLLTQSSVWTTYTETGIKNWIKASFSEDSYATFSSFGSGQPNNVAWLISPEIDMDKQTGEKLYFESCHDGFLRSRDNSLELYVSTDYDAVTFANSSWEKLDFVSPTPDNIRFIYIPSGVIDLSSYKGKLRFALKMKGTSALTGGYQVDKVKLFY